MVVGVVGRLVGANKSRAKFAGSTQFLYFSILSSPPRTTHFRTEIYYFIMSFGGNAFGQQQQQPNSQQQSFITAHRNQNQGGGGGIVHQQQQHVAPGNLLPPQPGQLAVPPPVPQPTQQPLQTTFSQVSQEVVDSSQKPIVPYGAGSEDDGVSIDVSSSVT